MSAQKKPQSSEFKVYYDGQCVICSKEIEHYIKKDTDHRINFVDISTKAFNASEENLDPKEVQRVFHIRDSKGVLRTGVDGFIAIWDELEIFSPLSAAAKSSLLRPLFDLGYVAFSKARPFLPRKKCDDGSCSL